MNNLIVPYELLLIALAFSLMSSTKCHEIKSEKETIHLLTVLPYPNPDPDLKPSFNVGDNIRPALELAKDQINNNPLLLQNYTLNLIHGDGGCQTTSTTAIVFAEKLIGNDERVTGIIGPGCSRSTGFMGSLTRRKDLSLVHVHGAGNPELADRVRHKYMLGTLGSTESHIKKFLDLKEEAGWVNFAVLFDDARLYFKNTARLLRMKTSIAFLSPVSRNHIPLQVIQEERLRITFVLCPVDLILILMCLAYHEGMIYPDYQWVIMDRSQSELIQPVNFNYEGVNYDCSRQHMMKVTEKAFLTQPDIKPLSDSDLVVNTSYEEYLSQYEHYRNVYNLQPPRFSGQRNSSYTRWATYFYDMVWAWALVLHNLTTSRSDFEIGSEYGNTVQADMIVQQFYKTNFSGMSGEISFDVNTGFTMRTIRISQISFNDSNETFSWIPDTFPVIFTKNVNDFGIVISIQMLIIAICHILTMLNHKKPSIKAASSKLLHISYVGIYVISIGTFIWLLDTAADFSVQVKPFICQLLWAWCFPIGFILSFMPVATRTWRIYRIFKSPFHPGSLISDTSLISMIMLALLVVIVVAITWTVVDPFYLQQQFEFVQDESGTEVQTKNICTCFYHIYWSVAHIGFSLSILVVVSIFSFLTRNISKKSFTTASLRVMCYVTTIIMSLGISMYYFFANFVFDPAYSDATLAAMIYLMIAVFTVCIFVPPLLPIFKSSYFHAVAKWPKH